MKENKISMEYLREMLQKKRGPRGIRQTAAMIGISPATLSRLLRGHLPDIETFKKLCDWLEISPAEVLNPKPNNDPAKPIVAVHFRKKQTVDDKTAKALAELIMAAHRAVVHSQADMEE